MAKYDNERSSVSHEKDSEQYYLKQISPFSVMLGCHILVRHLTLGGWSLTERKKQKGQRGKDKNSVFLQNNLL